MDSGVCSRRNGENCTKCNKCIPCSHPTCNDCGERHCPDPQSLCFTCNRCVECQTHCIDCHKCEQYSCCKKCYQCRNHCDKCGCLNDYAPVCVECDCCEECQDHCVDCDDCRTICTECNKCRGCWFHCEECDCLDDSTVEICLKCKTCRDCHEGPTCTTKDAWALFGSLQRIERRRPIKRQKGAPPVVDWGKLPNDIVRKKIFAFM